MDFKSKLIEKLIPVFKKSYVGKMNYFMIIVFLMLSLSSALEAQERELIASVPMEINMGAPNIEVFINGKGPFRFDFDTGASGSVISNKLANSLGLETVSEIMVKSPGSDEGIKADVVLVPNISVSNLKLKNIKMITMDFGSVLGGNLITDGVLSLNDFSDYLITFNYPEEMIRFEKGFLHENDKNVIPFWGQIMNVEIKINGEKKNAHFDTGFQGSFAFPYYMSDKLKFKSPPVESGTAGMIGAGFKIWKAQLDGEIHLGNTVFDSPEIILEERSNDNIVIGYQALKNLVITIDKQNKLVQPEKKVTSKRDASKLPGDDHEFAGRYAGVRSITYENGDLYLQRDGGMKLKLAQVDDYLYEMVLPDGLIPQNKLPKVRFDRNENNEVYRLTFVHEDSREEHALKD